MVSAGLGKVNKNKEAHKNEFILGQQTQARFTQLRSQRPAALVVIRHKEGFSLLLHDRKRMDGMMLYLSKGTSSEP